MSDTRLALELALGPFPTGDYRKLHLDGNRLTSTFELQLSWLRAAGVLDHDRLLSTSDFWRWVKRCHPAVIKQGYNSLQLNTEIVAEYLDTKSSSTIADDQP